MFKEVFDWGIISQGKKKDLININVIDLRNYTHDKHRQVDDRPLGGGVGMVLKPEPLFEAITDLKAKYLKTQSSLKSQNDKNEPMNSNKNLSHVIFLTPQGKTFTQERAETLTKKQHIILICGRYEGIDQRVRDELVDEEISIGNYVLSGGEFPAMIITDAVVRLIPGVIENKEFNVSESYSNPNNRSELDYPQYTRPADYKNLKVPPILLSGNHKEIQKWRESHRKTP